MARIIVRLRAIDTSTAFECFDAAGMIGAEGCEIVYWEAALVRVLEWEGFGAYHGHGLLSIAIVEFCVRLVGRV